MARKSGSIKFENIFTGLTGIVKHEEPTNENPAPVAETPKENDPVTENMDPMSSTFDDQVEAPAEAEAPTTEATEAPKAKRKSGKRKDAAPAAEEVAKQPKKNLRQVDESGNTRCPKCGEFKPADQFGVKANGQLRGYCKACDNLASKESRARKLAKKALQALGDLVAAEEAPAETPVE